MNEKGQDEANQEPAPIKESDANRVTEQETQQGPSDSEAASAEDPEQSQD